MRKFITCSLMILSFPAFGLTDAAVDRLWRRSLNAYERDQYDVSKKLLLQLVKARPLKALYWFNLGNSFFMLNQDQQAIICFSKVEKLKSPLAQAAILYRAKALARSGEGLTAERDLNKLLARPDLKPSIAGEARKDLLSLTSPVENGEPRAMALNLYRQGRFPEALRILRRERPLTEESALLKSMILIRLNRADEAQNLLSRVARRDTSGTVKGLATSLLDQIRDTYSKAKWVYLEMAAGSDSNIHQTEDSKSGTVMSSDAGAGARLWSDDLWYANAGYNLSWRETFGESDLRAVSHEVRATVAREVGFTLRSLALGVRHDSWDDTPARLSEGLTGRVRAGFENWEWGLDGQYHLHQAQASRYSYTGGSSHGLRLYAGAIFTPHYVRAYLDYYRDDIGDQNDGAGTLLVPTARQGYGPGLRWLWKWHPQWVGELNLSFTDAFYPTRSQPDNILRRDKTLETGARLIYLWQKDLSAYATWTFTSVESTYDSYNRHLIYLGALWDVI
ncbi:MAG: tetratricopeptide repeat protein [Bdellovibrionales bacterium]